ncbi:MAG TPA: PAS domain S-box protein [Acetobacteraceae bacterium]|nr:PAS domain S-box protein [Acetobacteraceae bacterium]
MTWLMPGARQLSLHCYSDQRARKALAKYSGLSTRGPPGSKTGTAERAGSRDSRCRAVLDALPIAIYTTDAGGRITYYNQAAVDLAGRRPELGKDKWCVTWRLYWPDGTPMPHDQCPMAVALKENRAVRGAEAILERPDGTRIAFNPYPTPLHDGSGALVGAVNLLVDITDRKASESARAYLAAIVSSSDDAIISKNLNGIITSWNAGATAIFGYQPEEMIGRSILTLIPPDRVSEEDMVLGRLRRGERIEHFETVRLHKDGHQIDVSLTISPVRSADGRIIGASKIARDIGERKRAEQALLDLNQTLERRIAERTQELCEANNRLMAQIAERERSEEALRQAQKMEAIGQLASGMAHDFNNLLTAILGNLELIEMRADDDRLSKLVQAGRRSVQRGARLNEQILAFSRRQHLSPRPLNLNRLIRGIQDMLGRTLGGTAEVTTSLAADIWIAHADPHQLEMVVLNLAINARDAMPQGGTVLIETRNVSASGLDRTLCLTPGDYVLMSVTDTGTGMSKEVLARACEPFFTTKEVGKGSGLGLAQAYGLAHQSGGALQIKSEIGQGTTVDVYLPRSFGKPDVGSASMAGKYRKPDGEQATVLVVDDQKDVREATAGLLEALGYQVAQAANGNDALVILGHDPAIDVLVVDYAMPEMTGTELARQARVRLPTLPVLLVTGYVDAEPLNEQLAGTVLLKKPYGLDELAEKVAAALAGKETMGIRPNVISLRAAARA